VALTVPDTDDLLIIMRRTAYDDTREEEFAELCLQQATDLMYVATGLNEDPVEETDFRIMTSGLLEMGYALLSGSDDRESRYSPFSSERIGSYSYSKAAQSIWAAEATGVPLFDIAVKHLRANSVDSPTVALRSEAVYPLTYAEWDTRNDGAFDPDSILFPPGG